MALFRETVAQPMDCHAEATVCSGTNCLVPPDDFNAILSLILSTVITVMLVFVMFSMGCSVELYKFLGHLRRPWGITIGFLCQFGIMPFTAFILSLAFNVLPVQAVVIIIMGCCPGGSGSNIICYYLDGDMDLSISMTACSSILALGMMPLCLLIYTSLWVSPETILIPYDSIGITLVALLVPIGFGMLVKHKWPQTAKKILKIGSIAGFILITVIAVVGGILYQSSWDIDPALWIIGTIFPFIGGGLGFLFACFTGQPWYRCRTIAVETGFQNAQLCSTITQLSFSPADLEIMFSFPLIYTIFQMVAAFLTVASALSNFAGEGLHGMLLFAWNVPQYGIKFICLHGDKHGMPASQVTGFQLYKRKCRGEVSEDSESPYQGDGEVGAGKIKALENSGFELNEDSLEKSNDYDKNTQF